MGTRRLERDLAPHARVAIDAAPLIYFLSKADPWGAVVRDAITAISVAGGTLIVSSVTEIELLVGPLKRKTKDALRSIDALLSLRGVEVKDLSRKIAKEAAAIRATHGLDLPDAVVAGTASVELCSALIGNDVAFKRVKAPWRYLHVDDYVRSSS